MEDVSSSSSSGEASPAKREVIDLESDYDDDEDRVRQDMYEDFDELADLAVTASEEPPPPGTRPLQEELLTLITENTVSGVTINKDDVVTWLRNEEAALTGDTSQIIPERLYPSPPSSAGKYSDKDSSDKESRSEDSPPKKKPKKLTSVAVRQDDRTRSRESSHNRERSQHRSHYRDSGRRDDFRSYDLSRHRDTSYRHRVAGRDLEHERTRSRDSSPITSSRYRSGTSQHARSDRHRQTSPHRESSYDSSYRRQRRDNLDNPRLVSRRDDSRHSSPRRGDDSPRRSSSINRRVKVQHRIVDDNNKTPQYKEVSTVSQKSRRSRVDPVSKKMNGIKDARELLSDRRPTIPVTDYIKSLKEQIQNSEKNARHMFRELQTAKRDLLDYLQGAGLREDEENLDSDHHEERKRSCKRRDGDRDSARGGERMRDRDENRTRNRDGDRMRDRDVERTRVRDEIRDRGRSREEPKVRRKSPERKRSRDFRRPSPERESRKSSSSTERGSEDPRQWKIIPPSEVDGFNCGGPAIFVQNFSRKVSKKHLYSHFQSFGTIVDIAKLDIGRKRIRSACVIFSRQSEADRVLQLNRRDQESPVSGGVGIDLPTPPSTFDLLLTALKSDKTEDNMTAAVR